MSRINRFSVRRVISLILMSTVALSLVACSGVPLEKNNTDDQLLTKVVLLHGLQRSSWSMKKIERRLKKDGFSVCNVDYPTSEKPVLELIDHIDDKIKECFGANDDAVSFVTHSMGGIMVRALVLSDKAPTMHRTVMLAPPNHGSKLVDIHRNSALFRLTMGPVAPYLGTDAGSLPQRLGPATFDVGIIAGTGRSNPLGAWVYKEPSDGTVSVASARLEGMNDFITVPYGHTNIMRKTAVINEIAEYLAEGAFSDRFKHLDEETDK